REKHHSLKMWFADYLAWLIESDLGKEESGRTNNHSSWYDAIVCALALFADDLPLAEGRLRAVPSRRIDPQIRADGSMPRELQRTRSLDYTVVNLQALTLLADLASKLDIDLWHYEGSEGQSVIKAV